MKAVTPPPEPVFPLLVCIRALAEPDMAKRIADLGASWAPNSPADFARFLRADLDKWRQVVAKSGAKFD